MRILFISNIYQIYFILRVFSPRLTSSNIKPSTLAAKEYPTILVRYRTNSLVIFIAELVLSIPATVSHISLRNFLNHKLLSYFVPR